MPDVQQLMAAAQAGDPQAIAMLKQMQGGGPPQLGGANPGNAPAMEAAGMAPPGGMPPMGAIPPAGGAPPMSQSQFSGYGQPQVPPDVAARRAAMLVEMLRQRGR